MPILCYLKEITQFNKKKYFLSDIVDENQRFLLRGAGGKDPDLDVVDGVVSAAAAAGAAGDIYPSVDPETQAKLEALFETAGIGKLSGETKQFTDPEVRNVFFIF